MAREAAPTATPARPQPVPRQASPRRAAGPRARTPARLRRSRRGRATGPLAAQRRTQNLVLAAGLALANVLLWTQVDGWLARLVALVVTVALWPVIVTVVFDRRSS